MALRNGFPLTEADIVWPVSSISTRFHEPPGFNTADRSGFTCTPSRAQLVVPVLLKTRGFDQLEQRMIENAIRPYRHPLSWNGTHAQTGAARRSTEKSATPCRTASNRLDNIAGKSHRATIAASSSGAGESADGPQWLGNAPDRRPAI